MFNGIGTHLGNLATLSDAKTRSITAENVYGEKGRGGMAQLSDTPQPEVARLGQPWQLKAGQGPARDLGQKWKVRPSIALPAGVSAPLMDVEGPGCIQHIWIATDPNRFRDLVLRMYWDGEEQPSVEAPIGDFFCCGWNKPVQVNSLPINVNPHAGLNCYFQMPFGKRARITIENRSPDDDTYFYYQITYALTDILDDQAYFHAQFRRTNPLPYKQDYVILDNVEGRGHFVGTYMAWQQNNAGWWGEGEVKFFIDGDGEFPTICGTGTEDYFGGSHNFPTAYSAPYLGRPLAVDGAWTAAGTRSGMYRFHVLDPVRFEQDLRVTCQALGWRSGTRFCPLQDDIASVAYWYQTEPHGRFPTLPSRDELEVI